MSAARYAALVAIGLAGVAASPRVAAAFTRNTAIWGPSRIPVAYKVNAATFPSSLGSAAAMRAIDDGFATWQAPSCTVWAARNAGSSTVTSPASRDSENSVLWIAGPVGSWPSELGSETSTIGITTSTFVTNGNLTDADITLNAVGFRWGDGTQSTVDAQSILTHEEGHFLGLGHTQVSGSVMIATYVGGQIRALSADDRAGVCALYAPGSLDAGVPDGGVGSLPFGAVCTSPSQCASGLCIASSASTGFCSAFCADDCSCPGTFACVPLSSGGRVCAPGANRCGSDAGTRDAGADAGARDAGIDAGARDAGSDSGADSGLRDAGAGDAGLRDAGAPSDAAGGPDARADRDGSADASDASDADAADAAVPLETVVFSFGDDDGLGCAIGGLGRASRGSPMVSAALGVLVLLLRRRSRDPR
jgi:hypothetical protein